MNVAWCCAILLSFAARSRKSYWSILEWLHPGCDSDSDLSADFRNFGALNFPFKNIFKKCSAEEKAAVELGLRESP